MLIAFGNIARRFGVGRPPPSALGACGTSGRPRFALSESRGQVLWALGFAGLGVLRRSTSSLAGRGPPATGGSPRQTPCLPCTSRRNRWQPVATDFACFWVSRAGRFAADCHRLQPRGSIKAPSAGPEKRGDWCPIGGESYFWRPFTSIHPSPDTAD